MVKPREKRVPIMMSDEEMKAIDDWRFANRIATRSDAIRRLCRTSLETEPVMVKSMVTAIELSQRIGNLRDDFLKVTHSGLTFDEFKTEMLRLLTGLHDGAQRSMSEMAVVFAIFTAMRRPGETQEILDTLLPKMADLKTQDVFAGNKDFDRLFQELIGPKPDD